ncbi:helix-turn-helix domain-containing protein [Vibrio parahaemolyticus]|nr:helix-turn-helix domain-containing protein [Vibrio parahaemolyticus]
MKTNWKDLVKSRMKETKITQAMLAERMDKSQSAIAHWLGGNRNPSIEEIALMMDIVGLDKMTLNSDGTIDKPESHRNVRYSKIQPSYYSEFPLISAVQAGVWTGIPDSYSPDDVNMLPTTVRASEEAFWLDVCGDSMTTQSGPVSFPEGTRILVDPGRYPCNGSFVVAMLDKDEEATFKKLVIDAGQKYLKPLNPDYRTLLVDDSICRIIGVVVDAKYSIF